MRRSRWAPLGAAGIAAIVVWNTAKTVPDCVSLFQHEFRNPILDREFIVKVIDVDLIAVFIETVISMDDSAKVLDEGRRNRSRTGVSAEIARLSRAPAGRVGAF